MAGNSLGKTKKFDRALYNRSDKKSKDVIVKYLRSKKHIITNVKEKFSCDIESISEDGTVCFSETEIKYGWKGEWPTHWVNVRIPYRKQKLINKIEKNLTFYVLRADCKESWVISDIALKNYADIEEMPNKYVPEGEKFFCIHVRHIHKIVLD